MKHLLKQQGFTLIELLVALGVSAVIAVLAYQSINTMVNVKDSVDVHSKEMENLQRAVWTMQQDLTQLVARPVQDQLGEPLPAFQYREDVGLEFTRIAQYPTPNAKGGLVRVGYQLDNGVLYRLTWPVLDRAQDSEARRVALISGVSDFEVRVLDSKQAWQSSWPPQAQSLQVLPQVTEVSFKSEVFGNVKRLFMGVN